MTCLSHICDFKLKKNNLGFLHNYYVEIYKMALFSVTLIFALLNEVKIFLTLLK